jgi:hypothetical protein
MFVEIRGDCFFTDFRRLFALWAENFRRFSFRDFVSRYIESDPASFALYSHCRSPGFKTDPGIVFLVRAILGYIIKSAENQIRPQNYAIFRPSAPISR